MKSIKSYIHIDHTSFFHKEFVTVVVWTVWIIELTKTIVEIYRLYNASGTEDTVKVSESEVHLDSELTFGFYEIKLRFVCICLFHTAKEIGNKICS